MKKIVLLNWSTIIIFLMLSCITHYLLMQDNFLHISISSIIQQSQNLDTEKHLLVLALLPFYIATMIFGTAVLSVYLGRMIRARSKPMKRQNQSLSNFPSAM